MVVPVSVTLPLPVVVRVTFRLLPPAVTSVSTVRFPAAEIEIAPSAVVALMTRRLPSSATLIAPLPVTVAVKPSPTPANASISMVPAAPMPVTAVRSTSRPSMSTSGSSPDSSIAPADVIVTMSPSALTNPTRMSPDVVSRVMSPVPVALTSVAVI